MKEDNIAKRIALGLRLAELRKRENLTQAQVAFAISKERSAYAHYEKGDTMPSFETLVKLARLYRIPVESFEIVEGKLSALDPKYDDDWDNGIGFSDLSRLEQALILKVRTMSKKEKQKLVEEYDLNNSDLK